MTSNDIEKAGAMSDPDEGLQNLETKQDKGLSTEILFDLPTLHSERYGKDDTWDNCTVKIETDCTDKYMNIYIGEKFGADTIGDFGQMQDGSVDTFCHDLRTRQSWLALDASSHFKTEQITNETECDFIHKETLLIKTEPFNLNAYEKPMDNLKETQESLCNSHSDGYNSCANYTTFQPSFQCSVPNAHCEQPFNAGPCEASPLLQTTWGLHGSDERGVCSWNIPFSVETTPAAFPGCRTRPRCPWTTWE
ncbi:hypothetical protein DPMN_024213 [Dreissena polymorpha]|uniref:Uncharacterized protein n=1 Tax=Dreissena polymorpha TaxID=45954 RepID=A0A9D4RAK6_DREPO|nr:hypothetical protein DPMN_024213 [Dreissena polymorpha]